MSSLSLSEKEMQNIRKRIQRAFREIDPLTKVVFLITATLLPFILEGYIQVIGLFIVISIVSVLAGLSMYMLKRYVAYFAFLFVVLFALMYYVEGNIRSAALLSGLVFLRWVIILIVTLTVVFTTNPQDLTFRLISLKFPRSLAFVIGLTLRFFPFIQNEIRRVAMAQQARGFDLRINVLRLYRLPVVVARIFMPLIISLLKFSDEVTLSIMSRGITIEKYTQRKPRSLTSLDFLLIVANVMVLVATIFISRS